MPAVCQTRFSQTSGNVLRAGAFLSPPWRLFAILLTLALALPQLQAQTYQIKSVSPAQARAITGVPHASASSAARPNVS